MAPKKKKPIFSESNTRATPAILSQPAPSLASTQSSSATPQPASQSDYKLVDSWIKTQPVPESILKSWENIKRTPSLQKPSLAPLASPTKSSRSWRISTSGWTNKKPSHHMPRLSKNLFQHKSLYLQEFSKKFLYILVSSHLTWLIELTSSFSRLFKTDYPASTTSRSEQ